MHLMRVLKLGQSKTLLFVLMTSLILTACKTETFNTALSVSLVLPPVITYNQETLDKAVTEAQAGQCPVHVEFGKDYKLTRDRLRIAKDRYKAE
jgi:hypothetical protein